jgi:hypothetical protein
VLDNKRRDDIDPDAMRAFADRARDVLVDRAARRRAEMEKEE